MFHNHFINKYTILNTPLPAGGGEGAGSMGRQVGAWGKRGDQGGGDEGGSRQSAPSGASVAWPRRWIFEIAGMAGVVTHRPHAGIFSRGRLGVTPIQPETIPIQMGAPKII